MVKFTNQTVEDLANQLCKSTGGNPELKITGQNPHCQILTTDPDPKYLKHLKEQIAVHEQAIAAIKAAITFAEVCQSFGDVDVEEYE